MHDNNMKVIIYEWSPHGEQLGDPRRDAKGEGIKFLIREAYEHGEAAIPAVVLRKRLAEAIRLSEEGIREREGGISLDHSLEIFGGYYALIQECEGIEATTDEPAITVLRRG